MKPLLEISDITVRFGGVLAVDRVGFSVSPGEFLCLIGPNGAGKTTLMRAITGMVKPETGAIKLDGRNIGGLPIYRRARLGLALTHQLVRPFRSMTVLENVVLAAGHGRLNRVFKAMISLNRDQERKKAGRLLDMVGIADAADKNVMGQPLGVLKRLEVARALALKPKVLLLDEPLAGLNSIEAVRLADTIVAINKEGLTVVMIEHNLGEVLRVGHRLVVIDNGRRIADGDPEKVMRDPLVRAAYIGKEKIDAAA